MGKTYPTDITPAKALCTMRPLPKMKRRNFLSTVALLGTAAISLRGVGRIDPQYKLIAHRGGVVDAEHPENSPGSIEAAITRGYWMLEVDIRRTRDGEPILQHDAGFQRFYGNPGKVTEMTWAEIGRLRATPGGHEPIHFREACKMCAGRIRLMLDIKSAEYPEDFYIALRKHLERHDLLRSTYVLRTGGERAAKHIGSYCFRSIESGPLREAIARGEDVQTRYFLFEQASAIQKESVDLAHKHGLVSAAAMNTFRYRMAKRDEELGPKEDFLRATSIGVRHFQMDSRHEHLAHTK